MIDCPRRMFGIVVRERHAVKRHDFKSLPTHLEVQIAVGRGVHDTPELPFSRCDLDPRSNCPVHGKDFFNLLRFSSAPLRWDLDSTPECAGIRIMLDREAAHNHHTLTEPRYFGNVTFHALNDDGS